MLCFFSEDGTIERWKDNKPGKIKLCSNLQQTLIQKKHWPQKDVKIKLGVRNLWKYLVRVEDKYASES